MPDLSFLLPHGDAQPAINCPYCGSTETEVFSLFGSQLLTAQYYCRACHTPFEQVKNETVLADAARRDLTEEPRG
jgi:DNA-directed RNA polymerase subunit RPC12/RpoP